MAPAEKPPSGPSGSAAGSGGSRRTRAADGSGVEEVGAWSSLRASAAIDPETDRGCASLPLTDLGNAERWLARRGSDFRFCHEIGWLGWDGQRWRTLSEEKDAAPAEVVRSIATTVRAIANEAVVVMASGCREPEFFPSNSAEIRFRMATKALKEAGRAKLLRGLSAEERAEREAWLDALPPQDYAVDIANERYLSTELVRWAKSSESAATIGKVVKWAKGCEVVVVRPEELDADRMAFNVQNGTLRLAPSRRRRTEAEKADWLARHGRGPGNPSQPPEWITDGWKVRLDPHNRADLITKLSPAKYAPSAKYPGYLAFLERVQPSEHVRRFLQQWAGLCLTGDISEHKALINIGVGRNGKGTLDDAWSYVLGDYAGSIGIESLAGGGNKRRGDQATPDLARLPGVRFLRASEPEKGMVLNDGLIKQLTGGDPLDARHLNKGFFSFLPAFKLSISGNNRPKVRDLSHGMWSRIQLVEWRVTIPEAEIDRKLGAKLQSEASGILNWMVAGLLDWRANGLIVPDQVRLATSAYRDSSDDVGRFLSAVCEVSEDHAAVRVGARELHRLYRAWAEHAGGSPVGERNFKAAMEDKGFAQRQSDGMKWLGVRPRPGVTLEEVERGIWPRDGFDGPAAGIVPGSDDEVGGWDD